MGPVVSGMSTTTHPRTSTGTSAGASASTSAGTSAGTSASTSPSMASSSKAKANEMKKRWKMEEEMREFERECHQEARRKREALLDQAISDGIDVSSLTFLSAPLSSPDVSLSGSTAGDEITKLLLNFPSIFFHALTPLSPLHLTLSFLS